MRGPHVRGASLPSADKRFIGQREDQGNLVFEGFGTRGHLLGLGLSCSSAKLCDVLAQLGEHLESGGLSDGWIRPHAAAGFGAAVKQPDAGYLDCPAAVAMAEPFGANAKSGTLASAAGQMFDGDEAAEPLAAGNGGT